MNTEFILNLLPYALINRYDKRVKKKSKSHRVLHSRISEINVFLFIPRIGIQNEVRRSRIYYNTLMAIEGSIDRPCTIYTGRPDTLKMFYTPYSPHYYRPHLALFSRGSLCIDIIRGRGKRERRGMRQRKRPNERGE